MSAVWLAACRLGSAQAQACLERADYALLTAAESARLGRLQAPRRRQQFLLGHALLRALVRTPQVAAYLRRPANVVFPADEVPRLDAAQPPLCLGLAHSGDWVFAAAAQERMGLDGECYRPRARWRDLAMATCPELFAVAEPELEHFYQAWTLKEAWLKANGQPALLRHLQALRIRQPTPGDGQCLTSWTFGAGVMSCLASSAAQYHWPLGLPPEFAAGTTSVWALDSDRPDDPVVVQYGV